MMLSAWYNAGSAKSIGTGGFGFREMAILRSDGNGCRGAWSKHG